MICARAVGLVVLAGVTVGMVVGCSGVDGGRAAEHEFRLDLGGDLTLDLTLIPAGEFRMGSGQKAEDVVRLGGGEVEYYEDERPQHLVRITKPFCMGVTEVTQGQYEAVMGTNPSKFEGRDNPVEQVSWHDAVEFCRKLSTRTGREVRLPTEAEWEYACRAGTTTPFHTGDTISTAEANYDGDYAYGTGSKGTDRGKTMPVGGLAPNGWGLYDMHGNVWEWCQDRYGSYRHGMAVDPTGAEAGRFRVVRGGSWGINPTYCRSADRIRNVPARADSYNGFRVVASPGP